MEQVEQSPPKQEEQAPPVIDDISPSALLVTAAKTEMARLADSPHSGHLTSPLKLMAWSFSKRCRQLAQTYS